MREQLMATIDIFMNVLLYSPIVCGLGLGQLARWVMK